MQVEIPEAWDFLCPGRILDEYTELGENIFYIDEDAEGSAYILTRNLSL